MNAPDDLQKLWQEEDPREEGPAMWKALIQEKRIGWDELVTTENEAWYLVALCILPLTVWAAWRAKYPWVHLGYGLMSATIVLHSVATWITGRRRQERDSNLREHLQALMESYDERCRFIRRAGWWVVGGTTIGLAAVILGIPGNASRPGSWAFVILAGAGLSVFQWLANKHALANISRKRDDAAQLLASLLSGGKELR
jgi:hypothetical protein